MELELSFTACSACTSPNKNKKAPRLAGHLAGGRLILLGDGSYSRTKIVILAEEVVIPPGDGLFALEKIVILKFYAPSKFFCLIYIIPGWNGLSVDRMTTYGGLMSIFVPPVELISKKIRDFAPLIELISGFAREVPGYQHSSIYTRI